MLEKRFIVSFVEEDENGEGEVVNFGLLNKFETKEDAIEYSEDCLQDLPSYDGVVNAFVVDDEVADENGDGLIFETEYS
jgi:hypothetical protein